MTSADQAAKAAREQAERGEADAQVAVGLMYLTGRGLEQDAMEAVLWLRRAAEQNDPDAQHDLGVAYATGFHGMLPADLGPHVLSGQGSVSRRQASRGVVSESGCTGS